MTHISEELIIKFINNRCNDEELLEVKQWLDESDENAELVFGLEKTSMLARSVNSSQEEHDRILSSVKERIADDTARQSRLRRRAIYRWSAAAAVFAGIIICVSFLFSRSGANMITYTANNGLLSLTLPDSTRVWLNKNASITYPAVFAQNRREVKVNGEAYFEVTHDATRPFIAKGRRLDVTVLGTKFNFESSADNENSVSLLEGKVEVKQSQSKDGVVLSPGQKAEFNPHNGQMEVTQTNAALAAVWHDGLIHFHNSNIQDIAASLEELYNVSVSVESSIDKSKTYSGETVFYESVDSSLSALCETLPLKYTRQGTHIILSAKD